MRFPLWRVRCASGAPSPDDWEHIFAPNAADAAEFFMQKRDCSTGDFQHAFAGTEEQVEVMYPNGEIETYDVKCNIHISYIAVLDRDDDEDGEDIIPIGGDYEHGRC